MSGPYGDLGEPVVRDKRRIDPVTGELRKPAVDLTDVPAEGTVPAGTVPPGGEDSSESSDLTDGVAAELAERTADLQRLQAEYTNYRRRVDRDRIATQELALAGVLSNLLPVLDDIGRAREHGELEGGFKSVAEALEAITAKLGLTQFGAPGDPFDPQHHEALTHGFSAEVSAPTAAQVYQPGYKLGERVLRPARVGVVDPEDAVVEVADNGPDDPDEGTTA
ncbi:MAG: molecular chaperone GrpE [Frankiales bacterium]|nr:molecular chaperone GrpE [Frankiales bacterium]